MEAVLRVRSSEFNDELVAKIKALLSGNQNSEITISITQEPSLGILREESREQYFARLDKSIEDSEKGNVVTFNGNSFEQFAEFLAEQ